MWRTEWGWRYPKLVLRGLDVRAILQRHLDESTPFIFNAAVMGANQLSQIALRLVCDIFKTLVRCLRSVESFTISWPFWASATVTRAGRESRRALSFLMWFVALSISRRIFSSAISKSGSVDVLPWM